MITISYITLDGVRKDVDLDSVVDVVRGKSGRRGEWKALIVYAPSSGIFIELRDSPPDVRGNSKDEAEQVDEAYIRSTFGLSAPELSAVQASPAMWKLIEA